MAKKRISRMSIRKFMKKVKILLIREQNHLEKRVVLERSQVLKRKLCQERRDQNQLTRRRSIRRALLRRIMTRTRSHRTSRIRFPIP